VRVIPEACPGCGTKTGIGRHCGACGADLIIASPGPEHPLAALPPDRYHSPRTIALVASRWLWFAVALGVAGLAVDVLWLVSASGPDTAVEELISIAEMMDLVALVQLASVIVGGVLFLAWFHRAYGNIRALGVSEPRYRRGWAIGAWFIPLANLVIPKQLANDLWRAGDAELQPRDPGWQRRPQQPRRQPDRRRRLDRRDEHCRGHRRDGAGAMDRSRPDGNGRHRTLDGAPGAAGWRLRAAGLLQA
jgi:Domain of unknown function (DUF4328)